MAVRVKVRWARRSRGFVEGEREANARDFFFLAVVISDKAQRERPPELESSLSSGEAETVEWQIRSFAE